MWYERELHGRVRGGPRTSGKDRWILPKLEWVTRCGALRAEAHITLPRQAMRRLGRAVFTCAGLRIDHGSMEQDHLDDLDASKQVSH